MVKQLTIYLIGTPISAYFAFLAVKPLAGFSPRYTNVLLSTAVGFVGVIIAGILLSLVPVSDSTTNTQIGFRAILGWSLMSLSHASLLRGPNKERIAPPKAFLLVAIQVIAGLVLLLMVALLLKVMRPR